MFSWWPSFTTAALLPLTPWEAGEPVGSCDWCRIYKSPWWREFWGADFRIAACSLVCFSPQNPIKAVLLAFFQHSGLLGAGTQLKPRSTLRYIDSAHFLRSLLELLASLPVGQIPCWKFRWDYSLTGAETLKTAKWVYVLLRGNETSDGSSQTNSLTGIIHGFWILWIIYCTGLRNSVCCKGTVPLPKCDIILYTELPLP